MRKSIITCILIATSLFPGTLTIALSTWLPEHLMRLTSYRFVITAYLNTAPDDPAALHNSIMAVPGTQSVKILLPADGYRQFSQKLGNDAGPVLAGVLPNDVPTTMQIHITSEQLANIATYLKALKAALPTIDEVRYPDYELGEFLKAISRITELAIYLSYLLLAVGVTAGICTFSHWEDTQQNSSRQLLQMSVVGCCGGVLTTLLLLAVCSGMGQLGWLIAIPISIHMLPIWLGMLLGGLMWLAYRLQLWYQMRRAINMNSMGPVVTESVPKTPLAQEPLP
ncbi:MAG: hypothetical protein ACOYL3_23740 [Desulfuromonadaceae bacterium]